MNYEVCVNCKHYNHNVIERGSARYAEPFCALDKTQVVYLFTTCKIGKWEAKDESDSQVVESEPSRRHSIRHKEQK